MGDQGSYAAVVLAGGAGTRIGGTDKAALRRDGETLLDRLLGEVGDALEVVVVGPPRPTSHPVTWTREDPPGGGPAAGALAGLDALARTGGAYACPLVLLVAVDMAWVDRGTVTRLRRAAAGDGAVLTGPDGRRQLCALVRTTALDAARPEGPAQGLPVHRLLGGLDLVEVTAVDQEAADVDTPDDVARLDHGPPGTPRSGTAGD